VCIETLAKYSVCTNNSKMSSAFNSNISVSEGSSCNGLDVLAATASNQRLHERYRRQKELSCGGGSSSSSVDEDDHASMSSGGSSYGISKKTGLRKGKWTAEEEDYATRYIHFFSTGLLALPDGKTLRSSLAEKLQCDPMRVTKKFAGASCLGKKIHSLIERPDFSPQDVEMAKAELTELERRFRQRLEYGVGVPLPQSKTSQKLSPRTLLLKHPIPQGALHCSTAQRRATHSTQNLPATTAPVTSFLTQLARNAQLALLASSSTPQPIMTFQSPPIAQSLAQSTVPKTTTVHQATTIPSACPATDLPLLFHNASQTLAASPATSNDQLVQTLVLQIATQLQALAALSPSTLKHIQLQILGLGITAAGASLPAAPTATLPGLVTAHPTSTLLENLQAAAGQTSTIQSALGNKLLDPAIYASLKAVSTSAPVFMATTQAKSSEGSQTAPFQALESLVKPVRRQPVKPQVAKTVTPKAAPQNAASPNTEMYLAQLRQKHAEALAEARQQTYSGQQGQAVSVASRSTSSSAFDQGHAAKKQKLSVPGCNSNTGCNNNVVAFLPYEYATTVSSGSRTVNNSSSSRESLRDDAVTNDVNSYKYATAVSSGSRTVNSSSSSRESLRDDAATVSSGSATVNSSSSSRESLRDDAATVSSGSVTVNSSSSSRESLRYDAVTNDVNSYNASFEGDVSEQYVKITHSVPLRKRFRSSDGGGFTRRNLAEHDSRMEWMKNQNI